MAKKIEAIVVRSGASLRGVKLVINTLVSLTEEEIAHLNDPLETVNVREGKALAGWKATNPDNARAIEIPELSEGLVDGQIDTDAYVALQKRVASLEAAIKKLTEGGNKKSTSGSADKDLVGSDDDKGGVA